MDNLCVVGLDRLILPDLDEVVEEALDVAGQVRAELSDGRLGLHYLLNLLLGEVILQIELRWHDLAPD